MGILSFSWIAIISSCYFFICFLSHLIYLSFHKLMQNTELQKKIYAVGTELSQDCYGNAPPASKRPAANISRHQQVPEGSFTKKKLFPSYQITEMGFSGMRVFLVS